MSILDEFDFIKKIKPNKHHQSSILIKGIGDDAALYSGNKDVEEIVCMDTMVEEVHFSQQTMTPFDIGYKAVAVNISDIAAMGGTPLFYLVSIAVPTKWSEDEVMEIYKGMNAIAEEYKIDLIGGDTVSSKNELVITVTVIGRVKKDKHLLRSNAKPGDIVFVTGYLGDSAAGLNILLKLESLTDINALSDNEKYLISRHQQPTPQVEVGQLLLEFPRIALNDISDGVASEANEIAEDSDVKIIIDYDKLPISSALQAYQHENKQEWILSGGEDFELIGTIDPKYWNSIVKIMNEHGHHVYSVGEVLPGPSEVILKQGTETSTLTKKGYNHFKK